MGQKGQPHISSLPSGVDCPAFIGSLLLLLLSATAGCRSPWFYAAEYGHPLTTDAVSAHRFGHSVAISSDTLIVGAPGANHTKGAAYVFIRDSGVWSLTTTLAPEGLLNGDQFGWSVALDGDKAIVGAPGPDLTPRGSVYGFLRQSDGSWQEVRLDLPEPPDSTSDNFGWSVSIAGNRVVVGSLGGLVAVEHTPGWPVGRADIYEWTVGDSARTCAWRHRLVDRGDAFGFGRSVAISTTGDEVAVGAPGPPYTDVPGAPWYHDVAYVFQRDVPEMWRGRRLSRWEYDGAPGDWSGFGWSVSISGDHLVVGEPRAYNYDRGRREGRVQVYRRSGDSWVRIPGRDNFGMVAVSPGRDDQFGFSTAVASVGWLARDSSSSSRQPIVIVGAPGTRRGGDVFVCGGRLIDSLTALPLPRPADTRSGDEFGASVAVSETTVVVGAPGYNGGQGRVHTFILESR